LKITYTGGLLLISIHIALKYLVAKISRKKGFCFEIKGKINPEKNLVILVKRSFFSPNMISKNLIQCCKK